MNRQANIPIRGVCPQYFNSSTHLLKIDTLLTVGNQAPRTRHTGPIDRKSNIDDLTTTSPVDFKIVAERANRSPRRKQVDASSLDVG
jgi:hypothetical protein